ncbi:peptidoglycan -binding protein [Roseomonas sp. AR75]|uniref:peptidoglycan -binding protein n=1 Tax=Roseomonas sp. AR75 TaxID=2562311 RepID=UPI0010BFFAE5|nr:peptidoglycan -binding protein [Roseomonas sp. AR75]
MALGRGRRDRGGIDAWPGYVDALSTLLMVIIFVLLVFVLSQGFLSVALSSRDRALDRLNRQVAELGELLALERGQAEELRGTLGRTNEELRAAATARDTALRNLSLLRDERDRLATERDSSRGERDRLAARLADLEAAARGGSARVAELEGRLAEALARTEAVGGDAARTARTLTEAQRLLAAERAALEAVRRDLGTSREQAAALGRDLDAERRAREARERDLAAAQTLGEGLTRDLATERAAREARERELEASRNQAETLTRELAETRSARDANQRALATSRQEAESLTRDLAQTQAAREALDRDLAQRRQEAAALARDLAAARQQLEAARRDIAGLREEQAKLDQTVQADRATIEARLSDIAKLADQVRALEALRDQLERQAAEAIARAGEQERLRTAAQQAAAEAARRATESDQQRTAAQRAAEEAARARAAAEALVAQATGRTTEAERAAAEAARQREEAARLAAEAERQRDAAAQRAAQAERERQAAQNQSGEFARLSESARAQVALLNSQLEQLRGEIARLNAALDAAEVEGRDRDTQIAVLGQRLNAALAARVEELQSYRSDFFGRLRRVLGERPEVRIAGDRFVFQSEVLFPVGSAEMSPAGQQQIRDLARVLLDLAAQFPRDLSWVLRVDGHADRSPIRGGGRFANNWELSAARAIAVAQLLIDAGLPRNRVAAAAFGDTQPLDDRDTPEAYARNRRIELRLEAGPAPNAPADAPSPAQSPAQAPVQPATRDLREATATLACARVAVAETPQGMQVTGLGQRGTTARLRATAPANTRLSVAEFEGPYCGVLQALRQAQAGALGVQVVGGTTLPRRSLLRVDLALPGWQAEVLLVFLANDGQVVQLRRLERQDAGARLRIGEPQGDFSGWAVDEPLGTDLVLAIASEGPLFATPRPEAETTESFAPALAAAVAAAQSAGRRVAATAVVVEVVP